jgi:hypothetical protein
MKLAGGEAPTPQQLGRNLAADRRLQDDRSATKHRGGEHAWNTHAGPSGGRPYRAQSIELLQRPRRDLRYRVRKRHVRRK